MEQFLIINGLQIFTERYSRDEVPDNWDIPYLYKHSVIGCKKIILNNITINTIADYYYSIEMWFDETPMITVTLYNNNTDPIIEDTVVFKDYKYDTMINAIEILMGSFAMSLCAENLEIAY